MIYLYEVKTKGGSFGAVSLLGSEEAFSRGLPSKAIIGTVPEGSAAVGPSGFSANQEFVAFLHEVISKYAPMLPALQAEARRRGDGWVYLMDARVADAEGPVGPEEVIGAFQVRGSRVVAGTYRANANHLLVSERGVFQLNPWLQEKLLEELRALIASE